MATLGQALNAVAARLIPLLNSLSAKPDPKSQADAASLTRTINMLLTDAMQANAQDVESKLAADATALGRLKMFAAEADDKAAALATSEANVTRFVNLATHIGSVIVAAAGGDVVGCATALSSACGDLGIALP